MLGSVLPQGQGSFLPSFLLEEDAEDDDVVDSPEPVDPVDTSLVTFEPAGCACIC